jgi:hypothetical protein
MSSFLDDEEELFVSALLGRLLHQQHLLSDIMNVDSEIRRLKRRKRVHNTRHNREHGLDWMDGLQQKEFKKGFPPSTLTSTETYTSRAYLYSQT